MRIDPRRFFEFLLFLMLAMCLFFIYLRNVVTALQERIREDARYLDPAHHIGVDLLQRGQVHTAVRLLEALQGH